MSKTITVSEETYKSLEHQARRYGLESVEDFLEKLAEEFEHLNSVERENNLTERRWTADDFFFRNSTTNG